jgi:hypothetical protein
LNLQEDPSALENDRHQDIRDEAKEDEYDYFYPMTDPGQPSSEQ